MNKFGIQYFGKSSGEFLEKSCMRNESTEDVEIREVICRFQDGYTRRDIDNIEDFMKELFISGEKTSALGTGTGELFLGSEQVKNLIKDDWQYWGDVNIDVDNAEISIDGDTAWFATTGSVKYTFEDTKERYDSYVNFIKNKIEEEGLTAKQKITFINWVLALTYHQREDKKREYLWPLRVSGVLLKDTGKWKFVHLQFSIPRANFPDERFEASQEYLESYNNQNARTCEYNSNQMNEELVQLLENLEKELVGNKNVSESIINKYFEKDKGSYIIGPEKQWYYGIHQITEFFKDSADLELSIDINHAIASKAGEITWVTATGILKQVLTEEELSKRALEELNNLFQADITAKEKLFAAHRSTAYTLKEGAVGSEYTCPIRFTAVIINGSKGAAFHQIHFSFPSYWIFEGKLD